MALPAPTARPSPRDASFPPRFVARWTSGTFLGWLLAIVLGVLAAVLADAIGLAGSQTLVGLAAGVGVCAVQAVILRPLVPAPGPWIRAGVVGMGLPFLLGDLLAAAGILPYSLFACIAAGSLLTGAIQFRILRRHGTGTLLWVPLSILGWTVAAATLGLTDVLGPSLPRGMVGALLVIALWLSGGVLLGAITGPPLRRMLAPRGA